MAHVNISKANKDELIDTAKKLHLNVGWGLNKDVIQDRIIEKLKENNYQGHMQMYLINQFADLLNNQKSPSQQQQYPNDTQSFYNKQQSYLQSYRQEPSGYETRNRQSYPSIAQNLILDQVQAQAIVKQILDNQVGVGDPTLIDISNVNARIAAGQPGQYISYPKTNYNALINQQSQNLGSNVLPLNQKEERELNIEFGNEKEKEKELEKDQQFQASSDTVQQSDEVLLYSQVQMEPQQQSESFLQQPQAYDQLRQYKLAEEQQQDLQLQQMLQENEAMDYKLGSRDWGRNSISKDPYTQKKIGMRYQEHNVPSYIQLNAPLTKAEKANKSKSKKNFIKEKEMDETIKAQKQQKKITRKVKPKKKSK